MSSKALVEDLESLIQERAGYKPGTRRVWGKYEFEKQRDGKWKKVGKARAGGAGAAPSAPAQKAAAPAEGGGKDAKKTMPEVLAKLRPVAEKLPQPPPLEKHVEIAQDIIDKHKGSLKAKLDALKELSPPGADIKGRVKELESAVGKVARKPKYGTAKGLQDVTGTRVITDSIDKVIDTVNKIKKKYEIVDEDDYISEAKDGYRSHHLIARDENGLEFEIQVRTENQNKWADWAHDIYKPVNEAQEQVIKDHAEEIDKYRLLSSAYFYSQDNPKVEKVDKPKCPEVVKNSFGCL